MNSDGSPAIAAFRTFAAGVLAFILSAFFSGLVTFDSLGYWPNFVTQFIAFVAAGVVAGRVARRRPGWTVGISLGLTWGVIALAVGLNSIRSGGPIRSPALLVVYITGATIAASLLGQLRGRRESVAGSKAGQR